MRKSSLGYGPGWEAMNAMRMAIGMLLLFVASYPCSRAWAQDSEQPSPGVTVPADPPSHGGCLSAASGQERAGSWADVCSGTASRHESAPPGCRMCPDIYGHVEGLFLERSNGSHTQPLVILMPDDQTFVSTTDLQFGSAPGLRALLGAQLLDGWAIESSYLALFESRSTAFVTKPDETHPIRLPGGVGFVFPDARDIRVQYASQLNTVDLDLVGCRCCCDDCGDGPLRCRSFEWLAGFRYVNLTETLHIVETSDVCFCSPTYDIHTRNNLYGTQLGARYRCCRGRWSWEATGKAGVYVNDAQQRQQIVLREGRVFRDASAAGGHAAFLGELNVSGIYHLTDVWGLRAGYSLIGIEGVALAPDQLDFSADPAAGRQLDRTGGVLLHGVSLGLEARW